jgi:hypothetical protein
MSQRHRLEPCFLSLELGLPAAAISIHGFLRRLGLDMSQELEQGLNIKRRASIGYGQSERLGA